MTLIGFFEKPGARALLARMRTFKVTSGLTCVGIVLVLGGWIWAGISLGGGEPVILRYTGGEGINVIGRARDLAGIGSFALIAAVMNTILAFSLEARDRFLGKLTAAFTLFFGILIFIGFAAIISVN